MGDVVQTAKYNGLLFMAMFLGLILMLVGFTGRTANTVGAMITPHDLVPETDQ